MTVMKSVCLSWLCDAEITGARRDDKTLRFNSHMTFVFCSFAETTAWHDYIDDKSLKLKVFEE